MEVDLQPLLTGLGNVIQGDAFSGHVRIYEHMDSKYCSNHGAVLLEPRDDAGVIGGHDEKDVVALLLVRLIISPTSHVSLFYTFCPRLENFSQSMRLTLGQVCCCVVHVLTQGFHGMPFFILSIHLNMLDLEVAVRGGLMTTVLVQKS